MKASDEVKAAVYDRIASQREARRREMLDRLDAHIAESTGGMKAFWLDLKADVQSSSSKE